MKSKQGFTFIELVLSASIFAIVALAVYSALSAGLSAWRKTQKVQNLDQDIRLVLDKLTLDLENAVLYSEEEDFVNFTGEKNEVSFYSLVDDYQTIPVYPQLKKITYSFDESEQILQRNEQGFAESMHSSYNQKPGEIIAQVSGLNFYYCYSDETMDASYQWMDSWDSSQGLPQGIKIELELDRAQNTFLKKYVFIPTGTKGKEK